MQTRFRSALLVLPCLALALLLAGCPKRPVATVASAPAPAAPAPAPAPPAPAPAPAPAPTPVTPPPAPAPAPPPAAAAPAPTPAPPPAAPREYAPNAALKEIYFDFDKSNIRPGDAKILDASAGYLKANPNQLVLIEGHCDERGTIEYNLALGERRAKAAMNYLVAQGIDASRFTLISYGKERPVCTEKTEACWARNRFDRFLTKPR
jgi:peptidoglycan-associated lipoprotein